MALNILPALWPAFARAADTTDAPDARFSVDAQHVAEEFTDTTRSRQEAWMVAQRDLLEEAHRRCTRLERLYVILDKLEDMTTILDLLARLAAARHARHAAAVAFDNLLESRSTPSASSWRTC